MKTISIYSIIEASGIKRTFIDALSGGRVIDREVSEGHTVAGVDAEAGAYASLMARTYGAVETVNEGVVSAGRFNSLASR